MLGIRDPGSWIRAFDPRSRPERPCRVPSGPAAAAGDSTFSSSRLISSFSSLPGLKYGTFFGGTSTLSPVFGLRPLRGSRLRKPEAAEPAQLDLLAAMQRVDDALEYRVDDDFRVFLGEIGDPRDFLDELRFGHAAARRIHSGCSLQGPVVRGSGLKGSSEPFRLDP